MTDPLTDIEDEFRAEQHAFFAERQRRHVLARRPPVFCADGDLHADIAAWADALAGGGAGNLVLFGAVGVGKTWAVWQALERLADSGWTGTFHVVTPYELKSATDRPVDTSRLTAWAGASLLILDDFGSQRTNAWDDDALFALVDQRWQHRRPVVVTSNVLHLEPVIGERCASRLRDGATTVTLTGPDHRKARP
jgi:DNA replication protein DnaC